MEIICLTCIHFFLCIIQIKIFSFNVEIEFNNTIGVIVDSPHIGHYKVSSHLSGGRGVKPMKNVKKGTSIGFHIKRKRFRFLFFFTFLHFERSDEELVLKYQGIVLVFLFYFIIECICDQYP